MFFKVIRVEGNMIKMPLKAGNHQSASKTPFNGIFCWRADDGPTLNAGLGILTNIANKPYIFVIFQGLLSL